MNGLSTTKQTHPLPFEFIGNNHYDYVAVGFECVVRYGAVTRKTALSKRDIRGTVCLLNGSIQA